MQPAIEIKNLGKQYKLANAEPYISLRDVIAGSLRRLTRPKQSKDQKFWALKDIDLNIMPGERIGIIGRNGAGKSTLLKIISKITPPTTGHATIRGRVGSLLEVGTGFHPELTGMENIFLNGSILGLKRSEISRQLDAIIDFSGVEKFIDTPLKHYSSGMQLRLAFAVAAHLEPEILLIDEVLAVGDIEFQKKCIGKMEEVSKQHGRTILFVSHNMSYISGLCDKAILLNSGSILKTGSATEVINKYITGITNTEKSEEGVAENKVVSLINVRIVDASGNPKQNFSADEKLGVEMQYRVNEAGHVLWLGYNIHNKEGINIFDTHSVKTPQYNEPHDIGTYKAIAWIPANLLNTGIYFISCAVFNHQETVIYFHEKDIIAFNVFDTFSSESARGNSPGEFPGIIRPLLDWEIKKTGQ